MAIPTGHGGSVQIGTGGSKVVVPVGSWRGNWDARDADTTQSDTGGFTRYQPVVIDPQWEYSCGRDDTNYPEVLGFTPGATLGTLWFKHGATAPGDKLVGTMVSGVNVVCDNAGDVERVVVRGKGGVLSIQQTIA